MDDDFRRSLREMEPRQRIAALRKHIGMSQQQLAAQLDVHWITVSRLERGIIRLSREWIVRLAIALTTNEEDISPEPTSGNLIRVHGEIGKGGSLFRGQILDSYSEQEQFVGDTSYYTFQCDDFQPIARRNDIVKMVQVREDQWENVIGRMCLAVSSDKKRRMIGFLDVVSDNDAHPSEMWDKYVVRNIRREVVMDRKFDIESVATDIIFTFLPPSQEGDA